MPFPTSVRIVDVGPRDGLQNEPKPIDIADKVALVEALANAGVPVIETGSFVNPKWVPQMAGSEEVFQQIKRKTGVVYSALIPNEKGFERALSVGADEVAVFTAATDEFSLKNTNCTVAEGIKRFEPVAKAAHANGLKLRGYLSCALGCPYAGEVSAQQVAEVSKQLFALGCYEICISDTTGVGTPIKVANVLEAVIPHIPVNQLAVHFHDTYGQALANILMALQAGVAVVDSSVAGLGGCPYAKGASGNVATEDLVYMLNGMGITTGIDLNQLIAAGNAISSALGRSNQSKVARALSV